MGAWPDEAHEWEPVRVNPGEAHEWEPGREGPMNGSPCTY